MNQPPQTKSEIQMVRQSIEETISQWRQRKFAAVHPLVRNYAQCMVRFYLRNLSRLNQRSKLRL